MLCRRFLPSIAAALTLFLPSALAAHNPALGEVHFPTSCRASVQSRFDQGLALLHSFEYREAEATFREVEKLDPTCVIAAWGVALSTTERSGANAPGKDLARGWAEFQPWLKVPAGTEREQKYVEAVRALYQDYTTVPGDQRWQGYLTRMEELRRRFPEDLNAALFYGLGLTWTAGPGREGLQQRKKALAIFLPIFAKYPNNPGAAHYIIHAGDTADLAAEALPAARRYASIAPDSPHALHMPSHIFNRLGYWKDSIATNQASVRVALQSTKMDMDGKLDAFHALNNIEYAYLQLGEDEKARQVIAQIELLAETQTDPWLALDAKIYFDLETHAWQDAANMQPPASSSMEENFDAYWIETIGAARSGNAEQAKQCLEQYRKSETAWTREHGWGDVLGVALTEAEAWTLYAEGQQAAAIARLKAIAQLERDHPMYYADILPRPSGEMLGDMLLQMSKPAEALTAYEDALQLAPNRLDSLLGAMKSATLSGDTAMARSYRLRIQAEGGQLAQRK